jgi:dolichyl-phosphate beta-glucosyltransferase
MVTASQRIDSSLEEAALRALRRPPTELEVIIPAFNEERRLPRTLSTTIEHLASRSWSSAVVVVDNNSVDRTVEIVEQARNSIVKVHMIGCSDRGKGAAVRRGILTSTARYIGFIDADNATPIVALDDAMELLKEGYDAVIASRRVSGGRYVVGQPVLRRSGGWAFRQLAHLSLPAVADTQCGFKFFAGPLVREIARTCRINGFAFDVEVLARIARTGHTCTELPVAWSDVPGSTFSGWRDGLRSFTDLLRITMSQGAR